MSTPPALKQSEPLNSAASVEWDLSDLFESPDDPLIEALLSDVEARAWRFQETYKTHINRPDLTSSTLVAAIKEYESIAQQSAKPGNYASLRFSADTSDQSRGAFLQKMMERGTKLSLLLLFFELELAEVGDALIASFQTDPEIKKYNHYIDTVRLYKDHMLSETEERLLEETANTGGRAFKRLFDQLTSVATFQLDGEELSQSEILSRLYTPDREVRKAAASAFSVGLDKNIDTVTFIYNTLLQDKNVKDRLRKYTYAEQSRHLSNELTPEIVETVVDACTRNYDLVSRYYKIKRDILGLDELHHYDRYAPLFEAKDKVLWPQAKELVLSAFSDFSPVICETAQEFFDKNWIDAAPRKGKRGGAFCAYITPDLHPYVLQSYMEQSRDVMTLAHELGHGVHSSLSRVQTYFNFHGTLPLAELASTFGEMLVFERLQQTSTADDRLALYAGKIEDSFATIFRQASMYKFEQSIHRHRREKGELSKADFAGYWQSSIQQMFGDSLVLGEEHQSWWSYVGHFVGSPFYVYAYSFGELLVLSLYQKYKREGSSFAGKYLDLLRAGGSLTPQELMNKVDVNLADPDFWQGGIDVLAREVDEFERLWLQKTSHRS
jgi:oligoendopeptidase F